MTKIGLSCAFKGSNLTSEWYVHGGNGVRRNWQQQSYKATFACRSKSYLFLSLSSYRFMHSLI